MFGQEAPSFVTGFPVCPLSCLKWSLEIWEIQSMYDKPGHETSTHW